jgi:Raf kinase inhibitor-like YbhB/YbcL family protein
MARSLGSRSRLIATALVAASLVAACSADGGPATPAASQPIPPTAAAPTPAGSPGSSPAAPTTGPGASPDGPPASIPPSTPTTSLPTPTTETPMPEFVLTSTAFDAGGLIPRRYTCDGEDVSPELSWEGAPPGTDALVLVVDDPDANDWVHWIVLDMAGSATGALPRGTGTSPDAPAQGRNDFGGIGWGGPCPPSGTHRYTFTLYALAAPLSLPGTPGGRDVRRALRDARVLDKAVLQARYRRGG